MLQYDVFAQLVKDTKQNIIQREVFDKSLKDEIALNSSKYFKGLSQRAATLLATKLADTLLGHAKEGLKKNSAKDVVTTVSLSENELAGMQYLGGYVLQSLHKKNVELQSTKQQLKVSKPFRFLLP